MYTDSYTHVHVFVYIGTCMYIHVNTFIHTYIHICTCIHTHVNTFIHKNIDTQVRDIHMHTLSRVKFFTPFRIRERNMPQIDYTIIAVKMIMMMTIQ